LWNSNKFSLSLDFNIYLMCLNSRYVLVMVTQKIFIISE